MTNYYLLLILQFAALNTVYTYELLVRKLKTDVTDEGMGLFMAHLMTGSASETI